MANRHDHVSDNSSDDIQVHQTHYKKKARCQFGSCRNSGTSKSSRRLRSFTSLTNNCTKFQKKNCYHFFQIPARTSHCCFSCWLRLLNYIKNTKSNQNADPPPAKDSQQENARVPEPQVIENNLSSSFGMPDNPTIPQSSHNIPNSFHSKASNHHGYNHGQSAQSMRYLVLENGTNNQIFHPFYGSMTPGMSPYLLNLWTAYNRGLINVSMLNQNNSHFLNSSMWWNNSLRHMEEANNRYAQQYSNGMSSCNLATQENGATTSTPTPFSQTICYQNSNQSRSNITNDDEIQRELPTQPLTGVNSSDIPQVRSNDSLLEKTCNLYQAIKSIIEGVKDMPEISCPDFNSFCELKMKSRSVSYAPPFKDHVQKTG